MARSKSAPIATALVVTLSLLEVGCSTVSKSDGVGPLMVYREAATDLVNRAPSSMSLPRDGKSAPGDKMSSQMQADYHFALAESYSLEGNTARATEEYKLTLVYDPNAAQVRVRLAAEYVKQGLVSEAIEHAKAAVEKDPAHIDAHLLLGGLYSALRMYDDALKEYETVIKLDEDNAEAPLFVGALLAEQKKMVEASAQFEKLGNQPHNPSAHVAWYYLGRIRAEEGEKSRPAAEAAFQKSIAAKPSYVEAVTALGELHEQSDRKEKAVRLFQAFQEKYGPSASVAENLSRLYIEAKDYSRAFDQLAVIEASEPSDINVKAKMAFILIEQQKYPDAIRRLEEVLSLEPASDKIRFYLGAVFEEVKDYKSAVTHFAKVPAGSTYFQEATVHASYLHKLMGQMDKAIATIESGIKQKDDHSQFYALYASLLDDTKQYSKATSMLKDAVKKFPENAQLLFFLGNMHDRLGEREETLTSMRKVLSIDKDHVQALNFLAYTYADTGKNLEEAERLARRAMELQPEDGYILDTLGWILFKRGSNGEAIKMLEAAYKIQPNEAVIAEHLGDAYYQSQMPEKAKRLYLRAVEIESNAISADKIRSKIVSIDKQDERAIKVLDATSGDRTRKPASSPVSK